MRIPLLALILCMLVACSARANTITFETTPSGGVPVDDAALSTPYTFSGGTVRFFYDTNGNNTYEPGTDTDPHFERAGGIPGEAESGFRSTLSSVLVDTARTPALAAQLGDWFLRKQGDIDTPTPVPLVFIAAYNTTAPIRALSGEIWDIDASGDGNEQWRVEVLNSTNAVLATMISPVGISQTNPASLDGEPWDFAFNNLPDGVADIRITFIGTKTTGLGLAFNNFSPDVAVPEPSAIALLLLSSGALLRRRR